MERISEKNREKKSQNRDISSLCCSANCEPISTKVGVFDCLTEVVTFTENNSKMSHVFFQANRWKNAFYPIIPTAYKSIRFQNISVHKRISFLILMFAVFIKDEGS